MIKVLFLYLLCQWTRRKSELFHKLDGIIRLLRKDKTTTPQSPDTLTSSSPKQNEINREIEQKISELDNRVQKAEYLISKNSEVLKTSNKSNNIAIVISILTIVIATCTSIWTIDKSEQNSIALLKHEQQRVAMDMLLKHSYKFDSILNMVINICNMGPIEGKNARVSLSNWWDFTFNFYQQSSGIGQGSKNSLEYMLYTDTIFHFGRPPYTLNKYFIERALKPLSANPKDLNHEVLTSVFGENISQVVGSKDETYVLGELKSKWLELKKSIDSDNMKYEKYIQEIDEIYLLFLEWLSVVRVTNPTLYKKIDSIPNSLDKIARFVNKSASIHANGSEHEMYFTPSWLSDVFIDNRIRTIEEFYDRAKLAFKHAFWVSTLSAQARVALINEFDELNHSIKNTSSDEKAFLDLLTRIYIAILSNNTNLLSKSNFRFNEIGKCDQMVISSINELVSENGMLSKKNRIMGELGRKKVKELNAIIN